MIDVLADVAVAWRIWLPQLLGGATLKHNENCLEEVDRKLHPVSVGTLEGRRAIGLETYVGDCEEPEEPSAFDMCSALNSENERDNN